MSTLFDEPTGAHLDGEPVLWFGIVDGLALIADKAGNLSRVDVKKLVADVRWVPDRAPYREGSSGAGWLDLFEYETVATEEKPAPSEASPSASTGPAYITTPDGTRWDPSTNLPIDD